MESDITMLEIAFSNMAEEFKEVRQQQGKTNKALSDLTQKVEGFEQKLTNLKITAPPVNTAPITNTITQGIEKIKSTIEEQPKSITRQFKILLFPEYNAGEYYRLVFGRILFWIFVFLAATYLFALGNHYIEINSILKENQLENDNVKKAWKYLYRHNGKAVRDKMDSAYQKNRDRF